MARKAFKLPSNLAVELYTDDIAGIPLVEIIPEAWTAVRPILTKVTVEVKEEEGEAAGSARA